MDVNDAPSAAVPSVVKMIAPRGSLQMLVNMKKKPDLQKIFDDVDNMTDEEIDNCDQPKWIKKQLKNLKRSKASQPIAENLANMMQQKQKQKQKVNTKTVDHEVRKYTGHTQFIACNTSQIEITTGDVFLILNFDKRDIKMDTAIVGVSVSSWNNLLTRSEIVGCMTVGDFNLYRQGVLKDKYKIEDYLPVDGKITSAMFTHSIDRGVGEVLDSSKSSNRLTASGIPILITKI
jgi:hypothetical protein